MQLNSLVEDDEVFLRVLGKVGKQASMLHVMVLLKFLGSYGNAVAMQKIGHMMGILKGAVNDYVMWTCDAIWSIVSRWSSGQVSRGLRQVIRNKSDLDAILKLTLCACILHNLIEHPVPPDWFDDEMENLDQDNELNQSVENSTRRNQVFAYMLEGR